MQRQKAVTAHFLSKLLLSFGFDEQHFETGVCGSVYQDNATQRHVQMVLYYMQLECMQLTYLFKKNCRV